jgi:predicted ATPase with chaperone activity
MSARFARDEEITEWREDGWVLLDGLIGTGEPMYIDRNHSLVPPLTDPLWLHVEAFLYL